MSLALQAAFDSVDNALLLLDEQDHVAWANARFGQWMGIEAHEWDQIRTKKQLSTRLAGQLRQPDLFRAEGEGSQREEAVWDEIEVLTPERRILERLSRPVFDATGKTIGRLHVLRDITAGRWIHSKLLQTEKMAALGQLVSGIAHELNNPLTSIMGYAQLALAREAGPDHAAESSAARIFQEAQRAQRIVKNLLVFARGARPERAPVQLNEVVERTLALRSYELRVKNVAVHLDLDAGLPRIQGDAHQLQQVVLNLIVNAEQAIESRSRRAAAPGAAVGHIGIRTGRAGEDGVVLEICDDGPGIPPAVATRIFDPFFTTKPVGEGTGLGLSIAYGIVREHAGEISVNDSPQGFSGTKQSPVRWRTSFVVELPIGAPAARKASSASEAAAPAAPQALPRTLGRKPRVLVIEDEQVVARLISDVLRSEGMATEVAMGGQAGLERLLAAGAESSDYDLVICDLKMPGLDGPTLYRELLNRNHPAKDRILFITGDTLSRRTLEFIEKYQAPYLPKPFLADELRAAVHRCLGLAAEPSSKSSS